METEKDYTFKLTVLGTRGSMAISGESTAKYGHATSSYLVETGSEAIILDAGTGIQNMPDVGEKRLSLLISHSHIDHILGLPMFLGNSRGKEMSIYGATREGLTMREQLDLYIKRPLWPITMDFYPVKLEFCGISEKALFHIGAVEVSAMESFHPGGSSIFKLSANGKTIVYATDFEHDKPYVGDVVSSKDDGHIFAQLAKFSEGADLVLYDAQYNAKEYEKCKGFGHSSWEKALELYELAGPKEMLLIHHAPNHTDAFLDAMGEEIKAAGHGKAIRLAKEGDVVLI